jgi:hypothetical protein
MLSLKPAAGLVAIVGKGQDSSKLRLTIAKRFR